MTLLEFSLVLTAGMLAAAFLLTFVRLARGPSLPDRIVALDLIGVLAVGVIAVYSIAVEQAMLVDVAIVLAVVAFLGTVAFAYYLERRGHDE